MLCTQCEDTFLRRDKQQHLESECPLRPHTCTQCSKIDTYQTIENTHPLECSMVEVSCPNYGCEFRDKRAVVNFHRSACPKERVWCEYAKVGCDVKVTRDSLEDHKVQHIKQHLKLAMDKIVAQRSISQIPPRVFKMQNFEHYQGTMNSWRSPTFYSHPGGYKMVINVTARKNIWHTPGTHILVQVELVAGESDHNLVWPFQGKVTIELLNQASNRNHCTKVVVFEDSATKDYNKRPQKGHNNVGWGSIRYDNLKSNRIGDEYLKNDCLYLRIPEVNVFDDNKPWLTPTP